MRRPHFDFETALTDKGFCRIAGVDEVGRGPLAGPVVAAAVILDPAQIPDGLDDSKKLSAARREKLTEELLRCATVALGEASVAEIDRLNIRVASHLAMRRALMALKTRPDAALIDGRDIPASLPCIAQAVVKGDAQSLSIAAASIVAKTTRDAQMMALSWQYPGYGWENNAGYPTKAHREALLDIGVSPHHRRSFKPIHNILYQEK
ncbi:MAG: ribonuclease HII [Pseudomonadota bacterium]